MVRIKTIPFDDQAVNKARGITQAIQYPSVYILTGRKEAYVGETINIAHRIQQHYHHADRRRLGSAEGQLLISGLISRQQRYRVR